jgi:hypothetical protein
VQPLADAYPTSYPQSSLTTLISQAERLARFEAGYKKCYETRNCPLEGGDAKVQSDWSTGTEK